MLKLGIQIENLWGTGVWWPGCWLAVVVRVGLKVMVVGRVNSSGLRCKGIKIRDCHLLVPNPPVLYIVESYHLMKCPFRRWQRWFNTIKAMNRMIHMGHEGHEAGNGANASPFAQVKNRQTKCDIKQFH